MNWFAGWSQLMNTPLRDLPFYDALVVAGIMSIVIFLSMLIRRTR